MRAYELGAYDTSIRVHRVTEDTNFEIALIELDRLPLATGEESKSKLNAIISMLADIAEHYGASPEEMDMAIKLMRPDTSVE